MEGLNGQQTVEDFFNDNMEEVIRKLKECHPDVVSCLKEEIVNELTADDIDDCLKEDIADSYIEEYPLDSCDKALSNMSSYDSKELIINYLQDNL